MSLNRIYGVFLRYFFLFRNSVEKTTEVVYWTAIDLFLWGLTASFFASDVESNILKVIVSGIIFWALVVRSQYEININVLEELWNKNMINLFVSPLTFAEWIMGIISISLFKLVFNFVSASILVFFLYQVNILDFGLYIIPFGGILILNGWVLSFFISALLLKYGTKIQSFGWSLVFLFAPFSGIYYPIEALPHWAQVISRFIPMSYIFEVMREIIKGEEVNIKNIILSLSLSILYLILGIFLQRLSFKSLLKRGMINLQ